MAVPVPAISGQFAIKIAKDLIKFYKSALHQRSEERLSIYEGLVRQRYMALRAMHFEFNNILQPLDEHLTAIERSLRAGKNDPCDELDDLTAAIDKLRKIQWLGQPERREFYAHCATFAGSNILPDKNGRVLSEDERAQIRQLMAAICQYFETKGTYQKRYAHEFGGTLGSLTSTIEAWRGGYIPLTAANVRETREALGAVIARMSADWVRVASCFSQVEASLGFGIRLAEPVRQDYPALDQTSPAIPLPAKQSAA